MQFDTHTLAFVGVVLSMSLVVVMLPALVASRTGLRSSLAVWVASLGVLGLHWLMVWHGREDASLMLVLAVNVALTVGAAGFAVAIQRFKRSRERRVWLGLAILLGLAGNLWFGLAEPSYAGRLMVVGGSLGLLLLLAALPLLGGWRRGGDPAERMTSTVLLMGAVLMLMRISEVVLVPSAPHGPLGPSIMQVLVLLYLTVSPVLTTVGFVLMHARRANDELARQAGSDPLTGALNRRACTEFGARALAETRRHRRPLTLLLMDVDRFRGINDAYGNRAGDWVLRTLASNVSDQLRAEDGFGRIGGEEFVAVLPGTTVEEGRAVAERIRERLVTDHHVLRGQEIPVTLSIGVAGYRSEDLDFDSLLQQADAAMYAAKRAGGNRVMVAITASGNAGSEDGAAVVPVQSADA